MFSKELLLTADQAKMLASIHDNNPSEILAILRVLQGLLDLSQIIATRNVLLYLECTVHVVVQNPIHLGAALHTHRMRISPLTPRDELKRILGTLVSRIYNSKYRRLSPPFVASLQRGTYNVDVPMRSKI
jgi:hypothetical protein